MPSLRRSLYVALACLLPACSKPAAPRSRAADPRPLFEAFVQAWNRHDTTSIDTLVAAGVVEEDMGQGLRVEGPNGIRDYMRTSFGMIPDFDWKPTIVLVDASKLAAEWTLAGTYSGDTPTGRVKSKPFSIRGASVMETDGGRITRFSDYYSLDDFYRQVAPPAAGPKKKGSS